MSVLAVLLLRKALETLFHWQTDAFLLSLSLLFLLLLLALAFVYAVCFVRKCAEAALIVEVCWSGVGVVLRHHTS